MWFRSDTSARKRRNERDVRAKGVATFQRESKDGAAWPERHRNTATQKWQLKCAHSAAKYGGEPQKAGNRLSGYSGADGRHRPEREPSDGCQTKPMWGQGCTPTRTCVRRAQRARYLQTLTQKGLLLDRIRELLQGIAYSGKDSKDSAGKEPPREHDDAKVTVGEKKTVFKE